MFTISDVRLLVFCLISSMTFPGCGPKSPQPLLPENMEKQAYSAQPPDSYEQLLSSHPDSLIKLTGARIAASRRHSDYTQLIRSLVLQGRALTVLGSYSSSCTTLSIALHYCLQYGLEQELPAVLNNLAIALDYTGKYDAAVNTYFMAMKLAESGVDTTQKTEKIMSNIAGTMFRKEELRQAVIWYDKAEQLARHKKRDRALGTILLNAAGPFYQIAIKTKSGKDAAMARKKLEEALAIGVFLKDTLLQHDALVRLSMPLFNRYDPQTSITNLARARQLQPQQSDIAAMCTTLSLTAQIYHGLKQYDTAIKYFNAALKLADEHKNMLLVQTMHQNLSATWLIKGNYEKAFAHRILFEGIKDSLLNQSVLQHIAESDLRYKNAEQDKELSRRQLKIARQEQHIAARNLVATLSTSAAVLLAMLSAIFYRRYQQRKKIQEHQIDLLEKQKQIELLKGIMKGEEKERIRLARELHDGIGGMLTSTNFRLNRMAVLMSDHTAAKQFSEVQHMVQDIASEVRKAAHNLMPDVLIHHGLEEALLLYCDTVSQSGLLPVTVNVLGDIGLFDKATELLLYRIAQELIQNVLKHAHASYVVLQLVQRQELITISVEDDGKGFNTEETTGGYGLQNLIYRVQALQGHISINTSPDKGTSIYIEFDRHKLANLL